MPATQAADHRLRGELYPAGSVFYLYTPNLDHLSNDAENFGGLMTEVHICNSVLAAAHLATPAIRRAAMRTMKTTNDLE